MSVYINGGDFQKLAGCHSVVSMCDIISALRLVNENIDYLRGLEDQISFDMKAHLEEDREVLLKQAQHNIDMRKAKVEEEKGMKDAEEKKE